MFDSGLKKQKCYETVVMTIELPCKYCSCMCIYNLM